MSYCFAKTLTDIAFDDAVAKAEEALKAEGFGVLTRIDVKATMKVKLDVDLPPYLILGACNPGLALKALTVEPQIGAMLPCNVIVRETAPGSVEVAAVDPVASMAAVDNAALGEIAGGVRAKLQTVIAAL